MTRVDCSTSRLCVGLGLEFGKSGIGNGEVAANAVGGLVMAYHIIAIGSNAHVTF